jgi:hypothetical protein
MIVGATIGAIAGSVVLRPSNDLRPIAIAATAGAIFVGLSFVVQRFPSKPLPQLAPAYAPHIGRVVVTLGAVLSVVIAFNLLVRSDARSVPARSNAKDAVGPARTAPSQISAPSAPASSVVPTAPASPQPSVDPPAPTPETSSAPQATVVPESGPAATSPVSPFATPPASPPAPPPSTPTATPPAQSVPPATPQPTAVPSPTSIIPTIPTIPALPTLPPLPAPTIRLP